MKLYLDIDGVLLHPKEDKAAEHAAELIEYITSEFDCYWLTTHCKGDAGPAVQYLSEYFPDRIIEKLTNIKPTYWETLKTEAIDFYERKVDPAFFRISDAKELFQYVRQKRYLPVVERIINGKGLSIPMKKRIAKSGSSKKRVVYSLPEDETMVLKLLTWMIIRKYDACLPENLYSFRPHYGAKDALKKLVSIPDISEYYSYKLDVRNYFNSIDINLLLPQLKSLFADDEPLYGFIASLLSDSRVLEEGVLIEERKGVMAGMPYAVFLANVYMAQMDRKFAAIPGLIYCRYSDDIILFSKDKLLLDDAKAQLH